jgi:hypothetical protein
MTWHILYAGSDKDVLASEVSRLKVELSAAHEALAAQRWGMCAGWERGMLLLQESK